MSRREKPERSVVDLIEEFERTADELSTRAEMGFKLGRAVVKAKAQQVKKATNAVDDAIESVRKLFSL